MNARNPFGHVIFLQAVYDDEVWKYIRYEFYRPLEVFWKHDETGVDCTATCGGGQCDSIAACGAHELIAFFVSREAILAMFSCYVIAERTRS